tara:strand:+ start:4170 stop:4532 length:363 start_codon:yes stop_codon:yes gene_type:complete
MKVGDKVRVIKNVSNHLYSIDSVVTIKEVLNKYIIGLEVKKGMPWALQFDEFQLIKDNAKTDPIVKSVIKKLKQRSKVGIKKYGTTLKDNNTDDFLQHLKEELMDGILYIQKLQEDGSDK